MDIRAVIILLQIATLCSSVDEDSSNSLVETNKDDDNFEYLRTDPANELGIYARVIAQIFRPVNQTTDEFRINRDYLPQEDYESLMARCKTDKEDAPIRWHKCHSDDQGLFAFVTWGVPEPKNKTITYLELEFKPYSKIDENGMEKICIMEEVYANKAYVVLNTFSELPSNDSFPRGIVESVAHVHHHQLDSFGEHFLSIFGDKIDPSYIHNFGMDEYYDRDPPYECLLNIASSQSTAVIEEKCDIYCEDANQVSRAEMEDVLLKAKQLAQDMEKEEKAKERLTEKRVEL